MPDRVGVILPDAAIPLRQIVRMDVFMQGRLVVSMENYVGSHVSVQQGFEDVINLVKQPRVVDDVDCVDSHRETEL